MTDRLRRVLTSKRGASYLIVLAVTAFLMLVAASALTAASASGVSVRDTTDKELSLLGDSLSESLLFSLHTDEGDPLGPQIAKALYDSQYPASAEGTPVTPRWELTVELPEGALPEGASVSAIALSFPELSVSYFPAVAGREAVYEGESIVSAAVTAKPATAEVGALMCADYTVTYKGRTMAVRDSYSFSGGVLTDTGGEPASMALTEQGTWRLGSHEKTEG